MSNSLPAPHSLDRGGGGAAFDHFSEDDAAAVGLDDVATAYIARPVFSLHQDIGEDLRNEVLLRIDRSG